MVAAAAAAHAVLAVAVSRRSSAPRTAPAPPKRRPRCSVAGTPCAGVAVGSQSLICAGGAAADSCRRCGLRTPGARQPRTAGSLLFPKASVQRWHYEISRKGFKWVHSAFACRCDSGCCTSSQCAGPTRHCENSRLPGLPGPQIYSSLEQVRSQCEQPCSEQLPRGARLQSAQRPT